jgi:hypothetical protein
MARTLRIGGFGLTVATKKDVPAPPDLGDLLRTKSQQQPTATKPVAVDKSVPPPPPDLAGAIRKHRGGK